MGSSREKYPVIDSEECKGCGRCIEACPEQCLRWAQVLNSKGYMPAQDSGGKCIGCLRCFYTCPEPYAITVHRADKE